MWGNGGNDTGETRSPLKNKSKYAIRLTQLYVYFIIILFLATSFGLRRPVRNICPIVRFSTIKSTSTGPG